MKEKINNDSSEINQPDFWRRGHLEAPNPNVASQVVVETSEGKWVAPLKGGIEVVDGVDLESMQSSQSDVGREADDEDQEHLMVRWTGTDGETRRAEVVVEKAHFVPKSK